MPKSTLWLFIAIAVVLGIYSTACYVLVKLNWKRFLLLVIIGNGAYTILTGAILVLYSARLTNYDFIYFILELIVLVLLIAFEIKTYNRLNGVYQ